MLLALNNMSILIVMMKQIERASIASWVELLNNGTHLALYLFRYHLVVADAISNQQAMFTLDA